MEIENSDVETFTFKVDVTKLLIFNTFYPHEEIFFRELISNSIDALNMIHYNRFLSKPLKFDNSEELCIKIIPNKYNRTLTIIDTGIGMTKIDMIKNLGIITKSGMQESLALDVDISLIGQFGIGFYFAYLVADKITVISKHDDDEQYLWESNSTRYFSVRYDCNEPLGRGTKIILYIKHDRFEYLEESKIRELVSKYFQLIDYPIKLLVQKGNKEEDEKKIREKCTEYEILNEIKSVLIENLNIQEHEYKNFYKLLSKSDEYFAVKNFFVDHPLKFQGVLYVPCRIPEEDMTKRNHIKLYSRRIFMMDNCVQLIPSYLNFIQGIVNIQNLPLNICRETLRRSQILNIIRKKIVENCFELLNNLQKNAILYKKFYEQFGKNYQVRCLQG
ncbi:heat shock protein 83-like [Pogonomyrmex barbatus]|uniref:Heat shock protein 83-like n=1 Tax=Pogonomyrmex barbatus TaxID=144034 RepID=A0A6I9VRE0_9HYME|nr:heat shock protein 83-like [Pogonomyrmex barbatus]